jgi:NTE family protein
MMLNAQKVGLVLSGGGSSGITHIGVLKALEEYNIPIDFITGTSMGGLVGAFYAAGYSPAEIEELFISDKFKNWAQGNLNNKYTYYLREKDETPAMIPLKIDLKSIWEMNLPTNLVSPSAINYGLMEYLAPSTAMSKGNFDSLFIPFRCVASDIITKKPFILSEGDLSTAVRASMAYPLYLSPVTYKNKLLFDGGLYNNFPSNIMYDDFLPDYIIGSNVSSNFSPPNEDNIISQIKAIIADDTEYSIECKNSLIIEPQAQDYSTFNFNNNKELIQIGYDATLEKIEVLLKEINRRKRKTDLLASRELYRKKLPKLIFEDIEVSGLAAAQNMYVRKSLRFNKDTITAENLKPEYIKISSDDKIKSVYPSAIYNEESKYFTLQLTAKKEKDLFLSFGGVVSSRAINEAYVGVQYNILGKTAVSILAETYFGRLHNSISGGIRLDFPFYIPFYWKTTFTLDRWDYFKSKSTFFEDTKPPFLLIKDSYFKSEVGFPVAYKGKIIVEGTAGEIKNEYYQTQQFLSTDTTDLTRFRNFSGLIQFEKNSLDRKQYASKGGYFSLGTRFVRGEEYSVPGSTSIIKDDFKAVMDWIQVKMRFDQYFNRNSKMRFGVFGEAVYSNQPFFNNYTSSILTAPAFEPISESKTLFQDNYRAHNFVAGGVKTIYNIFKNFQIRVEGYVFQPHKEILQDIEKKATYGKAWSSRDVIVSTSLVYNTPVGPIAVNLNYYDKTEGHWSFMFHFGYIIFNKKSLE